MTAVFGSLLELQCICRIWRRIVAFGCTDRAFFLRAIGGGAEALVSLVCPSEISAADAFNLHACIVDVQTFMPVFDPFT